jgi:hypothetical protein
VFNKLNGEGSFVVIFLIAQTQQMKCRSRDASIFKSTIITLGNITTHVVGVYFFIIEPSPIALRHAMDPAVIDILQKCSAAEAAEPWGIVPDLRSANG